MAKISGLLKETPKVQEETLQRQKQRKDQDRLHPAVRSEISIAKAVPVNGKNTGVEAYAPDGQQNAQAEQRGPDGVPVDAVRTAEHGQEIFQCGFGVWQRSFLRVAAVHQVGERQAQCVRQWFQRVDVRQTDARFP